MIVSIDKSKHSVIKEVDEGKSIALICESSATILWFHHSLLAPPVYRGTSLNFDKVKKSDAGSYLCYGKYRKKSSDTHLVPFISLLFLLIYGKNKNICIVGIYLSNNL